MAPEAKTAIDHNIFTPGNYFYNGVGHVTVCYGKILATGYKGIIAEARTALEGLRASDSDYAKRSHFLQAVITSCEAVIRYAERYAELARTLASACSDPARKAELETIAQNCAQVPANPARTFHEALQSFGLSKCCYKWNPAVTPFLPAGSTNTCIRTTGRTWKKA